MININHLQALTTQVRRDILRMVHKVNSGHPGGSLGCAEFFVTLYNVIMDRNDGFEMDGVENEGISDNKIIYYPALLFFLFIIGSVLIRIYHYLDELEGKM